MNYSYKEMASAYRELGYNNMPQEFRQIDSDGVPYYVNKSEFKYSYLEENPKYIRYCRFAIRFFILSFVIAAVISSMVFIINGKMDGIITVICSTGVLILVGVFLMIIRDTEFPTLF